LNDGTGRLSDQYNHSKDAKMALKLSLTTRWLGMLSAVVMRAWMSTQDYRCYFYDPSVDPYLGTAEPRIYVFWHEYILVPLSLRPHCDIVILVSRHRDAEVLARVGGHLGFGCVRGSTTRGATAALLELTRRGKKSHLAITPDGPQGPRREMAQGALYLASQSGMPIVPMGFGMARPKRMKSWDRFAIPRPFSRVRCVIGPAIRIPPQLSRDALEDARLRVESIMNDLTLEAEAWAEQGGTRAGDRAERRRTRVLQTATPLPVEEHTQLSIAEKTQRLSA
jgi:lysophospholipid acyltransferase (LPLAT)-like uncharacterized protein